MSAAPMKKSALPITLRPDGNSPRSRMPTAVCDQRAGIQIEHGLRVGLIAGGRIVAAQHQKIAQAERSRAEQIALQREPVAVAAGQLQHRLDVVCEQDRGRRLRAEMGARARAVRDVHGVGEALQRQRLGEQIVAVARDRRRDFGRNDKPA